MTKEQGDMKKRLVQFATEHLGITVHRFEKGCGLSNSYCSNPNAVGSYAQKKISAAHPNLNMDWVLTGVGSMIIGEEKANQASSSMVIESEGDYGKMNEELSALKKELELYKMLYEKEHNEVKAMSEQIGALKSELGNLKKEESLSKTESVNVKKKRRAS